MRVKVALRLFSALKKASFPAAATAATYAYINPQSLPTHCTEPAFDQMTEIGKSNTLGYTTASSEGQNCPTLVKINGTRAYAKNMDEYSVYREVIIGRIMEHIYQKATGLALSPHTEIAVGFDNPLCRIANTFNDALKSLNITTPNSRFGTLFATSSCIGKANSLQNIFKRNPNVLAEHKLVIGMGVALAAAQCFSSDTRLANMLLSQIIINGKNQTALQAIDWEYPRQSKPAIIATDSANPFEAAMTFLTEGGITEAQSALVSDEEKFCQQFGHSQFQAQAYMVNLNQEHVAIMAQMMQQDIQSGAIDTTYEIIATLTPEFVSGLVADQHIPRWAVLRVMEESQPAIDHIRQHLDLKKQTHQEQTYTKPNLSV